MQERRNLYLGPDRCADRTLHGSLRRPFQRDRRDLRAAEMADLHMREMILKLREQDVTLSYGPDELATDLQSF